MTRHSSKLEPPVPDLTMEAPKPLSPLRKAAEAPLVESRIWNTKNLGLRLGADFASGAGAATMVAPLITIIDKAIMQNASGQASLKSSLVDSLKTVLLRPQTLLFSKPFALICMLYGGTYFTANSLDTITSTVHNRPASHVTSGTAKFAASSAANVGLCLVKDATFAKLFGSGGPPRPVPLPSYALFTLRDCLTIFASFNIPPLLGPAISQRMNRELEKTISGQTIAQFAAPAAVQLVSTPMHLLGLDLYNRGSVVTWGDRWQIVKRNWGISAAARICRIVPAFGLGGVVNCNVRRSLMGRLE
ncbi:sequence orphan [Diplocarpon rosae]|nr:sequence orphan [Diplocarpon rosae]